MRKHSVLFNVIPEALMTSKNSDIKGNKNEKEIVCQAGKTNTITSKL